KEPRKDYKGEKVPTELDNRIKEVENEQKQAKPRVEAAWLGARGKLAGVEQTFTANHVWYTQQLRRLLTEGDRGEDPIQNLLYEKGKLAKLDGAKAAPLIPDDPTGLPSFDPKGDTFLSIKEYEDGLRKLQEDINVTREKSKKLLDKAAELTVLLSGEH